MMTKVRLRPSRRTNGWRFSNEPIEGQDPNIVTGQLSLSECVPTSFRRQLPPARFGEGGDVQSQNAVPRWYGCTSFWDIPCGRVPPSCPPSSRLPSCPSGNEPSAVKWVHTASPFYVSDHEDHRVRQRSTIDACKRVYRSATLLVGHTRRSSEMAGSQ